MVTMCDFVYYDINDTCRTCLSKNRNLKTIFNRKDVDSISAADLLWSCFSIEIKENDGLPRVICEDCLSKIYVINDFKRLCHDSELKLKNAVAIKTEEDCLKKENYLSENETSFDVIKPLDHFKCNVCNRKFTLLHSLRRHMKLHDDTVKKDNLCTFCGKCFVRMYDLKRHVRTHTNERPYSCDQCPKRYKQSSELHEHIKTHSSVKGYVCTDCGKSMSTRNGFYVHMKIHRGDRKHHCRFCGNNYITSGELSSHLNHIHFKNKLHKCSYESCMKEFVTKTSLEIHLRSHSGEKRYCCPICKKALSTGSSLREHRKTHTGQKNGKLKINNK